MTGKSVNPTDTVYDLLVIGGGINGCGIARDAAGRGLHVLLCEQDDLAAHTSSASTKLIHGGLRYLEHYEFTLVHKALEERERLLRAAPHLIRPLRFVIPWQEGMRPPWMLRAGLFLYDHLARRELLPGSDAVDLSSDPAGASLHVTFERGFRYFDGWVDDARLVLANALDAAQRGASILPRCRCMSARQLDGLWRVGLADGREVAARALVNAAGPWADRVLSDVLRRRDTPRLRLVQGSHIVVPGLFDHDDAYLLQNDDGRVVFAIPFLGRFTLIGTTEVDFAGDPARAGIGDDETAYLCRVAGRFFRRQISAGDVVWAYSGVRPLQEGERLGNGSASAVTRDYALDLDLSGAPLLSVLGGKLTTYRKLAEEAVDRLLPSLGRVAPAWTDGASLPGGDLPTLDPADFLTELSARHRELPQSLLARWVRAYGTRTQLLTDGVRGIADLGQELAPGLFARELDYLVREEWARTADDILWRRSKLGLLVGASGADAVSSWLAANGAPG